MLTERQKNILAALVGEYIKSAEPVASAKLARRLGARLSSATVRNEMSELQELDLIEHTHTSSGRVPTAKGFRFYVDELDAGKGIGEDETAALREMHRLWNEMCELPRGMARTIAGASRNIAVVGDTRERGIEEAGMAELIDAFGDLENRCLKEIGRTIDALEEKMAELAAYRELGEKARVFIGRENPLAEGDSASMVVRIVRRRGEPYRVIAIIGPRRMDYGRNIAIAEEAARMISNEDHG